MPKINNTPILVVNYYNSPISSNTADDLVKLMALPESTPGLKEIKKQYGTVTSTVPSTVINDILNGKEENNNLIKRTEYVEFKSSLSDKEYNDAAFILNIKSLEVIKNAMPGFEERIKMRNENRDELLLSIIEYLKNRYKDKISQALLVFNATNNGV